MPISYSSTCSTDCSGGDRRAGVAALERELVVLGELCTPGRSSSARPRSAVPTNRWRCRAGALLTGAELSTAAAGLGRRAAEVSSRPPSLSSPPGWRRVGSDLVARGVARLPRQPSSSRRRLAPSASAPVVSVGGGRRRGRSSAAVVVVGREPSVVDWSRSWWSSRAAVVVVGSSSPERRQPWSRRSGPPRCRWRRRRRHRTPPARRPPSSSAAPTTIARPSAGAPRRSAAQLRSATASASWFDIT